MPSLAMSSSPLVTDGADTALLNYTILVPHNETIPTGGNSLTQNLNVHYEVCISRLYCTLLLKLTRGPSVRRYRLDACLDRPRLTHDSWCRVWISIVFSFGVWIVLMIIRFFYSGLARRKSALSLIWLSMMAVGVTSFQWFFWGYSLSFSHSAGRFIGDLENIGFRNVLAAPSVGSSRIPDLLFAVYQGMFASIT